MSKKYNKRPNVSKGLLGALCIIIGFSTNYKIVNAESTVDDLKSYLGISVDKTEEEKEYVVIDNSNEDEHSSVASKRDEETSQIDIEKKNLKLFNIDLSHLMEADASPYDIINKLEEIKTTKNKIIKLGYEVKTPEIDLENINNKQLTLYDSTEDLNSRWYDIGNIGNDLDFCVDNPELIKPYGYLIEYTDADKTKYNILEDKHTGIDLISKTNSDVIALFNGKVYSIEIDDTVLGARNICISHSNGLYTIYRHIDVKSNIHKGDIVEQYQILGTPVGKSDDIENYVELQVIIDNKYINPILLFGNSGETLYREYAKYSDDVYVVESDEYYYHSADISIENPNKN